MQSKLSRRDRFNKAMNHEAVDRVVIDLFGCPQTTILSGETIDDIKKELGLTGDCTGSGYIDERILRHFNVDTRMTGEFILPNSSLSRTFEGGYYDPWGIGYKLINNSYEIFYNPLNAMDLSDIKLYPFPKACDVSPEVYLKAQQHAKQLYTQTDYVVVAQHPCYGILELGCWMFGFEDFLYRLAAEPETVTWFFDKIWSYQKEIIKSYYGALGSYIHCTTSGDDFGTQRGMMISLQMFNELIAPYLTKRIAYTKKFTAAYFQHHSCGSIYELIPTLARCGIDILNPIQPGAYQMEPENLLSSYGKTMSFWGGIDTQNLLVNATVQQVKNEVKRILDIYENNSSYIISPAHCIQSDVPAKNVIAIYDAIKEYYAIS